MFEEWSLNTDQIVSTLAHLGLAYLLAIPIGWNREKNVRSAGLRTFPLVSVGACAYMLVGLHVLEEDHAFSQVIYGITTGIGFIGGGAILKDIDGVHGTATAASIWNMGALGVAVAWSEFEIAIILCLLNLTTLYFVGTLKKTILTENSQSEEE